MSVRTSYSIDIAFKHFGYKTTLAKKQILFKKFIFHYLKTNIAFLQ